MYPIQQATITPCIVFMHDTSGAGVTGLVDGDFSTKRISKNGAAFGAWAVTLSELEGGFYSFDLSATDTATVGILTAYLEATGAMQANMQWRVTSRMWDQLAFPTVAGRSVDVLGSGEAAIDLTNAYGNLPVGQISGFSTAVAAQVAAELATYAPLTAAQGNALAASLALAAYTGVSTALAAFDASTQAQVTAIVAALEDISVAEILAATVDGSLDVQDALKYMIAWMAGVVVQAPSSTFTYYSQTSVALWAQTVAPTRRDPS